MTPEEADRYYAPQSMLFAYDPATGKNYMSINGSAWQEVGQFEPQELQPARGWTAYNAQFLTELGISPMDAND